MEQVLSSLRLREPPGLWHPIVPSGTSPLHHRVAATPKNPESFHGFCFPFHGNVPDAKERCNPRSPHNSSRASAVTWASLLPRDPGLVPGAGGREEPGAGRRRRGAGGAGLSAGIRPRAGGGRTLTHRGPRGAALPASSARCHLRRPGGAGPAFQGQASSPGASRAPRALPRAPSGRSTVTVCLFPASAPGRLRRGRSFAHPLMNSGPQRFGTRLARHPRRGISKQQWKEGKEGRRETGRGRREQRRALSFHACRSPDVSLCDAGVK